MKVLPNASTTETTENISQKQPCYISYRGSEYEREPSGGDSFEKENKTGKILGYTLGTVGAATVIFCAVCLHKGKEILKGEGSIKEQFKKGLEEIQNKLKGNKPKADENKPKADENKPKADENKPKPEENKPKPEENKPVKTEPAPAKEAFKLGEVDPSKYNDLPDGITKLKGTNGILRKITKTTDKTTGITTLKISDCDPSILLDPKKMNEIDGVVKTYENGILKRETKFKTLYGKLVKKFIYANDGKTVAKDIDYKYEYNVKKDEYLLKTSYEHNHLSSDNIETVVTEYDVISGKPYKKSTSSTKNPEQRVEILDKKLANLNLLADSEERKGVQDFLAQLREYGYEHEYGIPKDDKCVVDILEGSERTKLVTIEFDSAKTLSKNFDDYYTSHK